MWVTSVYGVKVGDTYELTAWIKTESLLDRVSRERIRGA